MDFSVADIQTLVQAYRECAAAHGRASFGGDYKTANWNADLIAEIYRELRRRGVEAQAFILPLLNDDDPSVRVWTATHALDFAPDKGEPVLMELSKIGKGACRLDAEMTLIEWKNGRLKFP